MQYYIQSKARQLFFYLSIKMGDLQRGKEKNEIVLTSTRGERFYISRTGIDWGKYDAKAKRWRRQGALVSNCERIFPRIYNRAVKEWAKRFLRSCRKKEMPKIKEQWKQLYETYYKKKAEK